MSRVREWAWAFVSHGPVRLLPTAALFVFLVGCAANRPSPDIAYFPPPPARPHVVHLKSVNTLHDLVPYRPSWAEVLRGGAVSPHVDSPAGIAFHDDRLYICDTVASAVQVWDLTTGQARWIGAHGDERLITPVAVAVDDAGNVYVADTGRGDVAAFSPDGALLRKMRRPDAEAYKPAALALRGNELYVADMAAHAVDIYSITGGQHLRTIGGPDRFSYPTGLAAGDDGAILVSELIGARVQVLDAEGDTTAIFGRPGNRYGDMAKPKHVAVAPDGVIFVADAGFARVHLFSAQGQLLMLLGGPNSAPGATPMPFGVAVAPSLPDSVTAWVPTNFHADYFVFVSNTLGQNRISLYAVGRPTPQASH